MSSSGENSAHSHALKPILLYDHLPGILAGYPAILFAIFAVLALPIWKKSIPVEEASGTVTFYEIAASEDPASGAESGTAETSEAGAEGAEEAASAAAEAGQEIITYVSTVNPHMLFWIGLAVMIFWYIAFAFNLPKNKFLLTFGLVGTFVGIPVALEITGIIRPFEWLGHTLEHFAPELNAGGWSLVALTFGGIWLSSLIYSRTHLRVKIDESGLTLNQLGGKGERFELIGLKTENEPLDYLELFLAGVGSLSLKTRMNKPIFTMTRVMGLYRTWWWPFSKGKLEQIEELLSFQGKVLLDHDEAAAAIDVAEMEEGLGEEENKEDETGPGHDTTDESPNEIN
ncbi:MAG: hypothetical protein AAF456_23270 [Planctomycetota bacterium]